MIERVQMQMRTMAAAALVVLALGAGGARAQDGADTLVRELSAEVIELARADRAIQAGQGDRIRALVESRVMPHIRFEAVTRTAVGPSWRSATPQQRSRLQAEFQALLIRVYAGALARVREQRVAVVKTVPVAGGEQVVVQAEVRGRGQPLRLDYRLDREAGADWKIIDVGIGGLWLVQSYRAQFAQEISKGGVDGLIAALAARNQAAGRP